MATLRNVFKPIVKSRVYTILKSYKRYLVVENVSIEDMIIVIGKMMTPTMMTVTVNI